MFEAYALMHFKNTLVLDNTGKSPLQMVKMTCEKIIKCYFMSIGFLRELDVLILVFGLLIELSNFERT